MTDPKTSALEVIQKTIVKLLATNPAGYKLCLIGGFRYRFLDQSVRISGDIDYHWTGDLDKKQAELINLFRRKLLPLISRQHGYEGNVEAATGMDAESPSVRIVNLAFWQPDVAYSRIEIPVEITRILCQDEITVRTADGVVYPTPSDMDMIESKVIAVFNRLALEYRDLVDIFLFSNRLTPDSPRRLKEKFITLSVGRSAVQHRLDDLEANATRHIRALDTLITSQVEPQAAANIRAGGGAEMVFNTVLRIIQTQMKAFLKDNT